MQIKPQPDQLVVTRSDRYVICSIDDCKNLVFVTDGNQNLSCDLNIFLENWIFYPKTKTWHYMKDVIG